jgi:hypothetical protein
MPGLLGKKGDPMQITFQPLLLLVAIMFGIPTFCLSVEAPIKSPEQAILDRWVGSWRIAYTVPKAEWTPEEKRGTAEVTTKRAIGGKFLQEVAEHSDKKSTITIHTYDEQTKTYRSWWFSSEGRTSESTGIWDADTATMTWTARDRGNTTTGTSRFLDADKAEWTVLVKDNVGKPVFRMEGKSTRIKESKNTLSEAANADDRQKRSPELHVLDRFVGVWDAETTMKIPGKEVAKEKGTETRKWSAGGKFVYFENSEGAEFHMLLTYDPGSENYPGVIIAGAFRTLVTGTWNAKTSTMTFSATFPDGNRFVSSHQFTDDGHAEASSRTTSPAGEVVMERTWKQTKRNK